MYAAYGKINKQFLLERSDGTEIDCSFHMDKLLEKDDLSCAARTTVKDQMDAARAFQCAFAGQGCHGDLHVHHLDPWPFHRILAQWLDEIRHTARKANAGVGGIDNLAEPWASQFKVYHAARARYITLCQKHHSQEHGGKQ